MFCFVRERSPQAMLRRLRLTRKLTRAAAHELRKTPKAPLEMEWGPIAAMVGVSSLLIVLTWVCLRLLP